MAGKISFMSQKNRTIWCWRDLLERQSCSNKVVIKYKVSTGKKGSVCLYGQNGIKMLVHSTLNFSHPTWLHTCEEHDHGVWCRAWERRTHWLSLLRFIEATLDLLLYAGCYKLRNSGWHLHQQSSFSIQSVCSWNSDTGRRSKPIQKGCWPTGV